MVCLKLDKIYCNVHYITEIEFKIIPALINHLPTLTLRTRSMTIILQSSKIVVVPTKTDLTLLIIVTAFILYCYKYILT